MQNVIEFKQNVKNLPDLPICRYTAVLKDGPATVKISRPTLPQLNHAVEAAVRSFHLHLVAVHSF